MRIGESKSDLVLISEESNGDTTSNELSSIATELCIETDVLSTSNELSSIATELCIETDVLSTDGDTTSVAPVTEGSELSIDLDVVHSDIVVS